MESFTRTLYLILATLLVIVSECEKFTVNRAPDTGKKRPIPKDGPQFDPDKIASTKSFTEPDPKFKNHVDIMILPNFGTSKRKDILFTYFGKWSLKSLVDSKEFILLIPYEFTVGLGYESECDKDKKQMNKVNSYIGDMFLVDVEINGEISTNLYILLSCKPKQVKIAQLWATYDNIKLTSMLIDSQRNPIQFMRIESTEKKLSRYAKTKKAVIKRYGEKGSNFWEWGVKNNLFGRRKITKFIVDGIPKKNKNKPKKTETKKQRTGNDEKSEDDKSEKKEL